MSEKRISYCFKLECLYQLLTNSEEQIHGAQSPIRLLRVSRCLIKSFIFFNMVQSIDLIFCNMAEILEQNLFNRADFLFRS